MAQTSSTNAGIPAGPNDANNLFLKVFSGEVLKRYLTKTVMKGLIREKTITSGRSAQFPAIGALQAEYHKPGNVILGQSGVHGEKTITINDKLIASVFVSDFEEAMNHYDTRSEYANQLGDALAQTEDQHLLAMLTKAAVSGTTGAVTGMGAATEDKIGASPTLATITDAIYSAADHFDSTNVPEEDRYCIVTPTVWWDLVQDGHFLNQDYGNSGNGSQAKGALMRTASMRVIKSNNLALDFTNDTLQGVQAESATTDYTVDGEKTVALCFQKQAAGTVQLMGLRSQKEDQVSRQGTLIVKSKAIGHGVLRPENIRLISAKAA